MTATNFAWSPSTLEIGVGDAVTFTNGGGSHNFVSDAGMGSCALPCSKTFPTSGSFPYHCGVHPTSMRGTIVVGSRPVVTIATPAPNAVVSLSFEATGAASSADAAIAGVQLRVGNGPWQDAALEPGATGVAWSGVVDVSGLANGDLPFVARATDANGGFSDATITVRVANPATKDLQLTRIRASEPGLSAPRINLDVRNDGTVATGSYHVLLEYFHDGAWWRIGETPAASVPGKATTTLSIAWSDGDVHVGRFDVRATLDSRGVVAETDESNQRGTTSAAWYTDAIEGVDVP